MKRLKSRRYLWNLKEKEGVLVVGGVNILKFNEHDYKRMVLRNSDYQSN